MAAVKQPRPIAAAASWDAEAVCAWLLEAAAAAAAATSSHDEEQEVELRRGAWLARPS